MIHDQKQIVLGDMEVPLPSGVGSAFILEHGVVSGRDANTVLIDVPVDGSGGFGGDEYDLDLQFLNISSLSGTNGVRFVLNGFSIYEILDPPEGHA